MKINWKVRFRHRPFLMALFSAILLFAQVVLEPFGIDTTIYNEQANAIFNAFLTILVLLGIVIDPTTAGTADSQRAMCYKKPKEDRDDDADD